MSFFKSRLKNNYKSSEIIITFLFSMSILMFWYTNCSVTDDISLSSGQRFEEIPDLTEVIEEINRKNPELIKNSCTEWDFIDEVVKELRNSSALYGWRFGYHCVGGNCNNISKKSVAFFHGPGSSDNHNAPHACCEDIGVIDVIANHCTDNPQPIWKPHKNDPSARWKYPRIGGGPTTTLCQNPTQLGTCLNVTTTTSSSPTSTTTPPKCEDANRVYTDNYYQYCRHNCSCAATSIKWLHTSEVANWPITSTIDKDSFQIKSNGEICISHSKGGEGSGKWQTKNNVAQGITGPVQANVWVIVQICGQYYAAIYEWLKPDQGCHLLDMQTLQNLYLHPTKSLGKRTNASPLDRWVPVGDDIVGFMVSGLAKNAVRGSRERSNIQWVHLPSESVKFRTIPDPGCCPPGSTNPLCQSSMNCFVPNRAALIDEIATQRSEDFQNSCQSSGGNWGFMDTVASQLHLSSRRRFGYNCKQGVCPTSPTDKKLSEDTVAYYCGENPDPTLTSSPVRLSNVIEDYCGNNAKTAWNVEEQLKYADAKNPDNRGKWLYPRPGGPDDPGRPGGLGTGTCTSQQLAQGFKTVNGECLPICTYFKKDIITRGVEIGVTISGGTTDLCKDTDQYNILHIDKKTHDAQICCRISKKTECSPKHYKKLTYDGETNCFPSCGHAANLAGWGGYGGPGVEDNPHTLAPLASCDELNTANQGAGFRGHKDWTDFTFYDPYRFKKDANNKEVYEVIGSANRSCCVRGNKTTVPAKEYEYGTYPAFSNTNNGGGSPTTSTTTQSQPPCDSAQRCCPGDTYANNPQHCPQPIDGECGSNCGECAPGDLENGTCYLEEPSRLLYNCIWDCKGANGGNTPGCTALTNSPCFE